MYGYGRTQSVSLMGGRPGGENWWAGIGGMNYVPLRSPPPWKRDEPCDWPTLVLPLGIRGGSPDYFRPLWQTATEHPPA
ncbi:hypothetical protein SUDANB151_00748 [Streptomyces sp. enrichment culture]